MNINCNWLRDNLAYDCRTVRTINGEDALEIGTPFSLADGTAIVFYVVSQGAHSLISDNGDTLAHLLSVGVDPFRGRRTSAVRNVLERFGASLEESGEIRALTPTAHAQHAIARYISGLLALAELQREWLVVPDRVNDFADEVEHCLRLWKPGTALSRHPKVSGISKHEYEFDFQWGNELVDVVVPNAQATGGIMRKLGDVLSAPGDRPVVRVVIDDRADYLRAEVEKQIIGSMASAMLFSSLQNAAGHQTMH